MIKLLREEEEAITIQIQFTQILLHANFCRQICQQIFLNINNPIIIPSDHILQWMKTRILYIIYLVINPQVIGNVLYLRCNVFLFEKVNLVRPLKIILLKFAGFNAFASISLEEDHVILT